MIRRKIILLIIELLITVVGYTQASYLPLRDFKGCDIVDKIENDFYNREYKYLIYGNVSCNYDIILMILQGKEVFFWKIENDSIARSGKLGSDSIFLYPNIKKTGVVQKEKLPSDTFIPPILCGSNTEFVIYKDRYSVFYFEYGKNIVSHKELWERKKYREEWLKVIRRELNSILECK